MKRAVLRSLLLLLLVAPGVPGALQFVHYQADAHSVAFSQSSFQKVHTFDSPSFSQLVGELEIEVEDETDRHAAGGVSSPTPTVLRVLSDLSGLSLFLPKRTIKLYILFHSWKSFLLS